MSDLLLSTLLYECDRTLLTMVRRGKSMQFGADTRHVNRTIAMPQFTALAGFYYDQLYSSRRSLSAVASHQLDTNASSRHETIPIDLEPKYLFQECGLSDLRISHPVEVSLNGIPDLSSLK